MGRNVVHGSDSTENGERETGACPPAPQRVRALQPPPACQPLCSSTRQLRLACQTALVPTPALPAAAWLRSTAHALLKRILMHALRSALPAALWFGKDGLVAWEPTIAPWLVE